MNWKILRMRAIVIGFGAALLLASSARAHPAIVLLRQVILPRGSVCSLALR